MKEYLTTLTVDDIATLTVDELAVMQIAPAGAALDGMGETPAVIVKGDGYVTGSARGKHTWLVTSDEDIDGDVATLTFRTIDTDELLQTVTGGVVEVAKTLYRVHIQHSQVQTAALPLGNVQMDIEVTHNSLPFTVHKTQIPVTLASGDEAETLTIISGDEYGGSGAHAEHTWDLTYSTVDLSTASFVLELQYGEDVLQTVTGGTIAAMVSAPTETDPGGSFLRLTIPHSSSETDALPIKYLDYRIKITHASNQFTPIWGYANVVEDLTR